jgi:type VI protein secretion system component VasK
MVFETVALSIIALLLFILLLSRKSGTLKLLLGFLTAAAAITAMVFFIMMQRASGNPDAGKELVQLYIPCGIYLLIALWSFLVSAGIHRKQKKEREAKRALKEAKKREAEAAKTE